MIGYVTWAGSHVQTTWCSELKASLHNVLTTVTTHIHALATALWTDPPAVQQYNCSVAYSTLYYNSALTFYLHWPLHWPTSTSYLHCDSFDKHKLILNCNTNATQPIRFPTNARLDYLFNNSTELLIERFYFKKHYKTKEYFSYLKIQSWIYPKTMFYKP